MTFATEQDVRSEANLYDVEEIPSELLLSNLDKAHQEILAGTILIDDGPVTGEIKSAEVRLTVSHLFRALVVSSAVSAHDWRATGLRVNEYTRMQNLMKISQELWEEAWSLLRPFLRNTLPASVLVTKGDAT